MIFILWLGTEFSKVNLTIAKEIAISLTSTNFENPFDKYVYSYKVNTDSSFLDLPHCKFPVRAGPFECKITKLLANILYNVRLDICLSDGTCTQSQMHNVITLIPSKWCMILIVELFVYVTTQYT